MHEDYCIPLLAGEVPQPPGADDFFGATSSDGEASSQTIGVGFVRGLTMQTEFRKSEASASL